MPMVKATFNPQSSFCQKKTMFRLSKTHICICHLIVVLLASSLPHFVLMVLNEFHVQIFIYLNLNSNNHTFLCFSLKEFMVRPLSNFSPTHSLRCLEMSGTWKTLCATSNVPTSRNQPKCNHFVCDYMQLVVAYD